VENVRKDALRDLENLQLTEKSLRYICESLIPYRKINKAHIACISDNILSNPKVISKKLKEVIKNKGTWEYLSIVSESPALPKKHFIVKQELLEKDVDMLIEALVDENTRSNIVNADISS